MTEDTNNLTLEILKRLPSEFALMREDMHGMRMEMTAIRYDLASHRTMQDLHHGDIASIRVRLDRVERRLDLAD